ncbi:MAG: DUF4349 domain-containing protein [Armatimonadetes bacterium]|nr:DUF4349 domain-containing protein [Armatimonadota bacterium]
MSKLIYLACAGIAIVGCGSGSGADSAGTVASTAAATAEMVAAQTPSNPNSSIPDAMPRKVIYKGTVQLACEDLDSASRQLASQIRKVGGYLSGGGTTGAKGTIRTAHWTVRIPSPQFDGFMQFLSGLGELESSNRQAEDVSEEYYDAAARLKNKKVEEDRLIDLLKRSSGKLGDVLTLEKELSRVREEAERIEGRMRLLANQADMSTIDIAMQEIKDFVPQGSPGVKTQVGRTFGGSMDVMKQVATALLLFLVAVAPWLIPLGLIAWIVNRVIKKARTKESPQPPPKMEL